MARATTNAGSNKAKYSSPDAARKGNTPKKTTPSAKPTRIKVSQDTIDVIKSMGMKKTLQMIPDYNNKRVRDMPGNKEFVEGARRMYGERRIAAAMTPKKTVAPKKPVVKSPDAARAAAMAPKKKTTSAPKYKSADSARRSSMK